MDILLVLGSVTAKQYTPVRFAMFRNGLKPKIVRVGTDLADEPDFGFVALDEALDSNMPVGSYDEYVAKRVEQLKQGIIRDAFQELPLRDVKAIIREPFGDEDDHNSKMLWLTSQLPFDLPEYTVMAGIEEGSFYLEGAGYGDLYLS